MRIDLPLTEEMVRTALRMGASEAEVFGINSRNLTVEVKKGERDFLEKSVDTGYSVRVIKDGRLGFSSSTDLGKTSECIETAIETARWPDPDEFLGLPQKADFYRRVKIFDPEVDSLDEKSVLEMALSVERAAMDFDKRITRTRKTSVNLSSGESFISNSHGISVSQKSTSISSSTLVIAEENGESKSGWGYQGSRFSGDLVFPEIGKNAAERALQLLGARRISPSLSPVILDNSIAGEFLGIFASGLSSEAVQKGKSLLRGKTGSRVASEIIDIADNALMDRLLGSRSVDSEGVAARDKTLVESGVLRGYLYNTYTARKDNTESTGNAVRGLGSVPSVGVTNLFIKPATGVKPVSFDSLVSDVDKGFFVTEVMGMHMANPISGDFSVGASGIWIENGRFAYPVREAVISGNILSLFGNIIACGDDLKFYGKIGSPSLLIKDVDISG